MVVINEEDIGKTPIQLLMDLVYESVGVRVPQHMIKYGKPFKLDGRPDILDDPNTFIPVRIASEYDYRLSGAGRGFMYRRRLLSDHFAGINFNLKFTVWPTTLHQIIMDQINPQLHYPLRLEDFEDYSITDESTNVLHIKAKPHSLFWTGGVNISILPPGQDYFILVEDIYLSGFKKWEPEEDEVATV